MPHRATAVWLPRVIFESALITLSILLALGLDEWRENRQTEDTIKQALSNFLSEIGQNKARVDDARPFNKGLHDVIARRAQDGDITSMSQFISIMDSYSPVVLQSTAWETALATGSLAEMDYGLVSALSLTYGLQGRYEQTNRGAMSRLTSPQALSADTLDLLSKRGLAACAAAMAGYVYFLADAGSREVVGLATSETAHTLARLDVGRKKLRPEQAALIREQHTVFTYLHLSASRELTEALMETGAYLFAYETLELDGKLPLLTPMSEVAGRMAIQQGASTWRWPRAATGCCWAAFPA